MHICLVNFLAGKLSCLWLETNQMLLFFPFFLKINLIKFFKDDIQSGSLQINQDWEIKWVELPLLEASQLISLDLEESYLCIKRTMPCPIRISLKWTVRGSQGTSDFIQ